MGLLSNKTSQSYEVFDDKTFQRFDTFYGEKWAKLKGEEIIILGDAEEYRVTEKESSQGESVYTLWIH